MISHPSASRLLIAIASSGFTLARHVKKSPLRTHSASHHESRCISIVSASALSEHDRDRLANLVFGIPELPHGGLVLR